MASGDVTGTEGAQFWFLIGAQFLRERAPGAEPAAGWRVDRAGQLAPDADLGLGRFAFRFRHRDRGDQPGGVRVRRALVDVVRRAHLDQLAEVHDADLVGHVLDHGEVVGDHHVGQAVQGLQALHQVQHLGPDGHVERAHRLVGHDHPRAHGQRPGQPDPLALAAGELVRVALDRVARQADLAEQFEDAVLLLLSAADVLHRERLADDGAHPHPRVKRGVRVLEHELQVAAHPAQFTAPHPGHVLAAQRHRAAVRPFEGDDHPADGGLAAPGLAHQAQRLPLRDAERHPGDGLHAGHPALEDAARGDRELLHQVADLQQVAGTAARVPVPSGLPVPRGLLGHPGPVAVCRRGRHREIGQRDVGHRLLVGRFGDRPGLGLGLGVYGRAGDVEPDAGRVGAAGADHLQRERAVHRVPAGEQVDGGLAVQRRLRLPALLGRPRAAGREPATLRKMSQVGRQPGDRVQRLRAVLGEPRDRGQ